MDPLRKDETTITICAFNILENMSQKRVKEKDGDKEWMENG